MGAASNHQLALATWDPQSTKGCRRAGECHAGPNGGIELAADFHVQSRGLRAPRSGRGGVLLDRSFAILGVKEAGDGQGRSGRGPDARRYHGLNRGGDGIAVRPPDGAPRGSVVVARAARRWASCVDRRGAVTFAHARWCRRSRAIRSRRALALSLRGAGLCTRATPRDGAIPPVRRAVVLRGRDPARAGMMRLPMLWPGRDLRRLRSLDWGRPRRQRSLLSRSLWRYGRSRHRGRPV